MSMIGRKQHAIVDDFWGDEWGGVDEVCDDCGQSAVAWHADVILWRLVIGPEDGGVFCPRCFTRRAMAAGFAVAWQASACAIAGDARAPVRWRPASPLPGSQESGK